MAIRKINPTTSGRRNMTVLDYKQNLTIGNSPEKSLLMNLITQGRRNKQGTITVKHQCNITIGNWLSLSQIPQGTVVHNVELKLGGGEGKAPIGRKALVTPWRKKALGLKTRDNEKASNKLIVRRRNTTK